MYALVNISGKQIRIEEGVNTRIPLQKNKVGSKITLDNILLFDDGKNKKIGNPYIKSLSFDAKIISHNEDKKILVYKKKRRKGYEKKLGHKQKFSVIKVDKLSTKKTTATKTKKKTNSSTSATKKKTVAKKSTKSK
tara:strand:+ start:1691 stop:2098 length:408 start_codon:yes stop_codon:yes gene_type:complete